MRLFPRVRGRDRCADRARARRHRRLRAHRRHLEDRFIDLAFELGPIEGLDAPEVKRYIRYVADWRLQQLGLPAVYGIAEHPLPWLTEILNGVEHANFFETRSTEYAKAATGGDWHGPEGAWGIFDARLARQQQIDLLG